ncbi:MAG: leucyl/phenylalanyl-tRNA--protein transferase [Alphaproteobacteria bacterium]|nr:leucyl/phenylalanyl-tRNA--protein transferase [Alphaproteobacteria bacterium]
MATFGPDDLLDCYRRGVFPMAESRDDDALFLVDPEVRAVMPLDRFHVPRRLARTVRSDAFAITANADFLSVLDACAEETETRPDTWINDGVRWLYTALHRRGYAHSIEARRDGALVGGLYGVAIGAAFFGESMFSRARDASKVALVHLVARLRRAGFVLLDAQFMTDHLEQFGANPLTRRAFRERLDDALARSASTERFLAPLSGAQALQSIAQMS